MELTPALLRIRSTPQFVISLEAAILCYSCPTSMLTIPFRPPAPTIDDTTTSCKGSDGFVMRRVRRYLWNVSHDMPHQILLRDSSRQPSCFPSAALLTSRAQ